MIEIAFAAAALPKSGAVILPADEDGAGTLTQEADQATGGAVVRGLAAAQFKPGHGKTCILYGPGGGLSRIVALGLGPRAALDRRLAEEAGGHAYMTVARETEAALDASSLSAASAAAMAFGAVLRSYRFDRYRTTEKPDEQPTLRTLTVLVADVAAAKAEWARLEGVAAGVALARDLVSEPPNVLNPVEMAQRCEKLRKLGLKVEVLGPDEMEKLGFGALLGVSMGSVNEPRVVVMRWNGASGEAKAAGKRGKKAAPEGPGPIAFVGKGVTFDTGGISIKPAGGMEDMKWDMAGAGAVVGLMAALAGRAAKVDAIGIVGLVENMPSGSAQRPGDVVTTYSGQTVEVINTDAEGRLVLADVLWYCQKHFAPRFMIDLATLTGAMVVALGHDYAGFFSNDEELSGRLATAGASSGERVWRMPLADPYDKLLKSEIADMKNIGGRPAGAISAAHFIQRFVNKVPWVHLDIAGTAWASKDAAVTPKGATAFGVRLLDRLVADHYES